MLYNHHHTVQAAWVQVKYLRQVMMMQTDFAKK